MHNLEQPKINQENAGLYFQSSMPKQTNSLLGIEKKFDDDARSSRVVEKPKQVDYENNILHSTFSFLFFFLFDFVYFFLWACVCIVVYLKI